MAFKISDQYPSLVIWERPRGLHVLRSLSDNLLSVHCFSDANVATQIVFKRMLLPLECQVIASRFLLIVEMLCKLPEGEFFFTLK